MWKVVSPACCRASAHALESQLNQDHPLEGTIIINWGNSQLNNTDTNTVFGNKLEAVKRSTNKRIMFYLLKNLGTVPVITEENKDDYDNYYIHIDPSGHNGSGIIYKNKEEYNFNPNDLVTGEVKGKEFRVYFAYSNTFSVYKKEKLHNANDSNIHNSHNGWGYESNPQELRNVPQLEAIMREYTLKVANRLELSYGAVDFIYGQDGYVYILETNSAPTLIEPGLLYSFSEAINSQLNSD
jgi:hypothetical protein